VRNDAHCQIKTIRLVIVNGRILKRTQSAPELWFKLSGSGQFIHMASYTTKGPNLKSKPLTSESELGYKNQLETAFMKTGHCVY
jgi:hypothetical protein